MGFLGMAANALTIVAGGLLGCRYGRSGKGSDRTLIGIVMILLGLLGTLENTLTLSDGSVKSENAVLVCFCLLIGGLVGTACRLEERLEQLEERQEGSDNAFWHAFFAGTLSFGVGGMQINGALAAGLWNDPSLLLLKSAIDLPFAFFLAAANGRGTVWSVLPVTLSQLVIVLSAKASPWLLHADWLPQCLAVCYLLLLLNGINLMEWGKRPIKVLNLLPAMGIPPLWALMSGAIVA
ncbi:MAG: DUF554 domain-containing protein [Ruminococcaceae bacterium]|nr:DUF554 domain-containing protein [Oscillospiraceae bacterium]